MKIVKPFVQTFVHYPFDDDSDIYAKPVNFIEYAGRTAYQSHDKAIPGSAAKFASMIKKNGHTSVFEHGIASAKIVTDRGVMAELTRHRTGIAFTVESTRYVNFSKDKFGNEISIIEPPGLGEKGSDTYNCWEAACTESERKYMALIGMKVPPEIARSVLPMCLKTEIIATANLREWQHIIKLRTASDAHPQIREVMLMVKEQLAQKIPEIFGE